MGFLEHGCLLAALAFARRASEDADGFVHVSRNGDAAGLPSISIVVPARDEERSIERCVRSLAAQTLGDAEIIVVDDRSSDATRTILARLETELPRLRVIDGATLPAGWVGKCWALHQGAAVAHGEWLLFTDADSWHVTEATASTLRFALEGGIDALTLATGQDLETFWERALLPSILGMVLFATGPVVAINDPARPDRAIANGQYIMVRRTVYDALGGHAALRGEIAEDLAFSRRIKADGRFRFFLAGGEDLVRVRMYHSLAEIWSGFTKNVFIGANGHVGITCAAVAFLSALSWLPPVLAVRGVLRRKPVDTFEALGASVLTIGTAAWGMTRTGQPAILGAYAPLGLAALAAITVNSMLRVLSGRGVEWRGRTYPG